MNEYADRDTNSKTNSTEKIKLENYYTTLSQKKRTKLCEKCVQNQKDSTDGNYNFLHLCTPRDGSEGFTVYLFV